MVIDFAPNKSARNEEEHFIGLGKISGYTWCALRPYKGYRPEESQHTVETAHHLRLTFAAFVTTALL
ncbi:hypothetical protein HVA01_14520 [Halovibrio variabilis]|uniref:Uncharacterized protein n=1 Tax=Halovibrio variabilis TaxID=31910 RepID=A0A511UMF7_9GAMM|nr:hypothetical protein HVA01_14520 [Halovibrio variabilis]